MRWLILALLWLGSEGLWAYDFSRCGERIELSSERVDDSYGVAIDESRLLHYAKTPPKSHKILKSDPYIGLYLLEAKTPKIPLELRDLTPAVLGDILGSGTPRGFVQGKVTARMSGWLAYAHFSQEVPANAIISSVCYQFYGLGVGGNRFIESGYIRRFLASKGAHYGDLRVRFDPSLSRPTIAFIDPFLEENPFRLGDVILTLEGQAVKNREELENRIYDLKPHTLARVSVKREGEVVSFVARVEERDGGMLRPDSFLKRSGLRFSPAWVVEAIEAPQSKGFERLEVGDRILRVNGVEMSEGKEGLRLLSRFAGEEMSWLIRRGDFEFFIRVNRTSKGE